MINIVYIIPSLIKAGPGNVLYDIISHIDKSKFNVIIYTLKSESKERDNSSLFESLGIKIYKMNYPFLYRELGAKIIAKRIESQIAYLPNVVVHAHTYHPTLIAAKLKKFVTITTIHNISIEDYVALSGNVFGRYMSARYNHSLKRISACVGISNYMLDYYRRFSNNLVKIVNGVNFSRNHTVYSDQLALEKQKLGVKYIVVTGRLSKRKNVLYIINELKKLKREDFLCLFVGTGEEMDNCSALINGDNRFMLTGYRTNVSDYLMVADLYISASHSEGMPLSVLEALNMGIPTLLSDIPPHKEIVDNMSLPSIQAFPTNNGELGVKVDYFLNTEFDKRVIVDKANMLYSSKTMAEKYEHLYCSLLRNNEKYYKQ